MRKFLSALIIIGILGSAGSGFFLYQRNKQAVRSYPPLYSPGEKNVEQLVPGGAALVFFIKGLGETWEGFSRSKFFLQLAEYQVSPLFTSLARPPESLETRERLQYLLSEEVFLGAFGQDVALAFFPSKKEKISFLITTKTGPLFYIEEFLGQKYMSYSGKWNFVKQRFGNFAVTSVPEGLFGIPVHYALVNGAMAISNSLDTLKLSLGIAEGGDIQRIVDSPLYVKNVGKSLAATRYGIYVDNAKLEELFPLAEGPPQEAVEKETIVEAFFSRVSMEKGIKVQTDFSAGPGKTAGFSGNWVSAAPEVLQTPHLMPSEAMLYLGVQRMNAGEIVKYFKEKIAQAGPMLQAFSLFGGVGKEGNVLLWEEDVLPLLGQEWCLAVVGSGDAEKFLPGVAAALEVKDVQQAAKLVEKSVNSAIEKRSYKEFEINRVKNDPAPPFDYFFHENFLFLAIGESVADNVIDAIRQEKPSLEKNKVYASSGVSPNNHLLFFFDTARLIALAESGLKNIPQELLSGFAKTGPAPGEILYLAGVMESLAMETVFTPEKIKQTTFIGLKDLPSVRKKGAAAPKPAATARTEQPAGAKVVEPGPPPTAKVAEPEPQKPAVVPPAEKEKEKTAASQEEKKIEPPPTKKETSLPQPPPMAEAGKTVQAAGGEKGVKVPEKEGEMKTVAGEAEKEAKEGSLETPQEKKEGPEEEFIYSAAYMGQQLRDPFASLIDMEIIQSAPTVDISSLWKELSKVEPINMYLYSRAQKENPKLTGKIEDLTEYFKDSKKLEKRPEEEVNQRLAEYSSMVSKLNSEYKAKVISPLNIDLDSLSIVGIVVGEKQNFALVQGSDQKGYTIKAEDIIGTNYGKVVSITKDQVTVEENIRDYVGKISTKTKKFKLKKEEE